MTAAPQDHPSRSRTVPELENGARLTRAEFHRRYEAMPHVKKAQLIEGVVYMPSPVSRAHGTGQQRLCWWLGNYVLATRGVDAGSDATVRLDNDNEPQPDAHLRILPELGGQTRTPGPYIEGAPELVAEVALSSASIDLHAKMNAYRRNGVREYLVWRALEVALDWFVLRDGDFEPLAPDGRGILKSETFPGLWLDPAALLRDDMPAVQSVLQEGLASPEHAAFAADLARRAASR